MNNNINNIINNINMSRSPDPNIMTSDIPKKDLPHCQNCKNILRPHIVWFGENLDDYIMQQARKYLL